MLNIIRSHLRRPPIPEVQLPPSSRIIWLPLLPLRRLTRVASVRELHPNFAHGASELIIPCTQKRLSFLNFPYVCPEPVLVN